MTVCVFCLVVFELFEDLRKELSITIVRAYSDQYKISRKERGKGIFLYWHGYMFSFKFFKLP